MNFLLNITDTMHFGQIKNLCGHFQSTSKYLVDILLQISVKTKKSLAWMFNKHYIGQIEFSNLFFQFLFQFSFSPYKNKF